MKLYMLICLTLAMIATATAKETKPGTFEFDNGKPIDPNEKLLWSGRISSEAHFHTLSEPRGYFPPPGTKEITRIKCVGMKGNDHEGHIEISKGGIGTNFVELFFTTGFIRGYDFLCSFYGIYE